MKKTIYTALFLLLLPAFSGSAFAASVVKVLVSAATGTVTGTAQSLGTGYKDFTIDVVTLGTGTVIVRTDCNASNDGTFDTTGMGNLITCGLGQTKCTAVYNNQPMLQCRGVITSAEGVNSTTVTLLGVQ